MFNSTTIGQGLGRNTPSFLLVWGLGSGAGGIVVIIISTNAVKELTSITKRRAMNSETTERIIVNKKWFDD